ncbi:hypothetical protein [Paracoccus albicereus]|nr:hypothetical protein [Paracoccus albicereus]
MEGFIGQFQAAHLVRSGRTTEVDFRSMDGTSILRQAPGPVLVPVVVAPVGWSGIAAPGETIEIIGGRYDGTPEPSVTIAIQRKGGSEERLEEPWFVLRASDLGASVTIIERATNEHGSVRTEAVVEVARHAPTEITFSGLVDVTVGSALPVPIARLSADGTAPLDWAITDGGEGMALDLSGETPVLRLVAMPTVGVHSVTVTATNAAGSVSADMQLEVLASVGAPQAITLSALTRDMTQDEALPVDLAELSCEGGGEVSWSVPSGGERFVIDTSGETPVLRLFSMPEPGSHVIEIEASNDSGTANAQFVLNLGAGALPTTQITQNPPGATLVSDAQVPTLLSILTADGTAPVAWSLVTGIEFCALQPNGSQALLRLIAMPPVGESSVTVRAENATGATETAFALMVQAPVVAPHDLQLSAQTVTVDGDATLPRILATLSAAGTAPMTWSLVDAEPYFDIDLTGDVPTLVLVEMPGEGRYSVEVEVANAAGRERAILDLTIAPPMVAPGVVMMEPDHATIGAGQALPVTLSVLDTDGSGPIVWTVAAGGDHCAIATEDGETRLMLISRPASGVIPVQVEARNSAGLARGTFTLTMSADVTVAPSAVALSTNALVVQTSDSLPLMLAEAEADGTAPLTWRLIAGEPYVSLDLAGDKPTLRLISMPAVGSTTIQVEASNGAGVATASFSLEVRAPSEALVTVNRGMVVGATRNADGSVSFALSGTDHDGDYVIEAAAMRDGLPSILVAPSVSDDGSTWAVSDDGLYAWPVDDEASLLVQWEAEGKKVGAGASFTRQPLLSDARITAVIRLANVASETAQRSVAARIEVQAPTIFPTRPIVYSSTSARATLPVVGQAQPPSLVIGIWGRVLNIEANGDPLWGPGNGGTNTYIRFFNKTMTMATSTINGGIVSGHDDSASLASCVPGDRFFMLFAIKPGQASQLCFSKNGEEWVRRQKYAIPATATIPLNIPTLRLEGWNFVRDRIAIWGPQTLPNFDDVLVRNELLDLGGRPKDPGRADAILGVPLLDDRGNAGEFNSGYHAGLWNNGAWTVSRPAVDHQV